MAEKVHAPSFSGNNIDTVSARQRFGADTGKSKGFGMWGGFAGPVKLNNNVDQGVNKPTNKGFDNFSTDRFRSGFEGTGFGGKATEKSESQSTNAAFGPALIWKNEPEFGTMGNKQEDAVQKEPSKAFDNVSVPSKSMNSFPGSSFGSINAGFGTLPNALKTEHPVARNNGQQFGAPRPGFDIPTNKTSLIGFGSGGNGSTTGFGTANTGGVSGTQSNRHEAQQQKAGSDDGLAGSTKGSHNQKQCHLSYWIWICYFWNVCIESAIPA
ncbi:unnamed protein product, partial [Mesorhabditis belari]|uniref:Uncharacterized protein n=1 Tax=Mesorhabditis belari TaxID=2138241 RepID=A0AAF3JA07_9BILA